MGVWFLALGPLAFAAYHLASRKQLVGYRSVSPSQASPGKSVSVVGIAQPWEQPGVSKVTGAPVLWSRAHFVRRSQSGPPRSAGTIKTQFAVVDEVDQQAAVAVDGRRLREVKVRKRTGPGSATAGRYEERAVYPGDRVWVHGRLEDRGGFLSFGRGALLHDEPPETRARQHGVLAIVGIVGTGLGAATAAVLLLAA